jgi:endonuclease/exonuclease/phosphatase family metal-dependent hydrolase
MRIATFNLENLGSRDDDADRMRQRLDVLRPQLQRMAADVLCLQEIDAARPEKHAARRMVALDKLLEGTVYRDFHQATTVNPATGHPADRHNLAVLSRWPIDRAVQHIHSFVQPPVYSYAAADPPQAGARALAWDRPFLHVRIRLADSTVLNVLNLHLKAPLAAAVPGQKLDRFAWKSAPGWAEGYFIAAVKRAGQALEVRMVIDRIFDDDPDAMILVAGDFNAEEREVPARIIAAELEDTANGDLASRVMIPLEHSLSESRRYSVIHRGRRIMLDHMFASRALLAAYQDMEIHNEALGDELVAYAAVDGSPESYHAPVVAIFRDRSGIRAG